MAKSALVFLMLLGIVFTLASADVENLRYGVYDYFKADSIRKMDISQEWLHKYNIVLTNRMSTSSDQDGDGLTFAQEARYGTNPVVADTDGDGYSDGQEVRNGYDPTVPGDVQTRVVVLSDKLSVAVPMVWSKSAEEASLDKDLETGVVHYPQSGIPGQNGNAIIAGHSSNYAWARGDYNSIFKNLNNLSAGDAVTMRVIQQNGKTFDYKYTITEKKVLDASNDWIFQDFSNEQVLTLTTCWPIGTDISRLVVRATRDTTPVEAL
jgi:LPXTG-site transpeptidase (sortase) family protein